MLIFRSSGYEMLIDSFLWLKGPFINYGLGKLEGGIKIFGVLGWEGTNFYEACSWEGTKLFDH